MTRHRVSCIIPHLTDERRIHSIGGQDGQGGGWTMTEADAIPRLKSGDLQFYTLDDGVTAEVRVMSHSTGEFLQTVADGIPSNNLRAQPRCPTTYKRVT